jgi:molecular chaperone DnaJ
MKNRRNLYNILGLPRTSDIDEVKSAFRRLALQYHPDHNPDKLDAEEKFKEIVSAYEVLGDPLKKAAYDATGKVNQWLFRKEAAWENYSSSVKEILNELFGQESINDLFARKKKKRKKRGEDLKYKLRISFTEAALGCTRRITIPRQGKCSLCGGSGAASDGDISKCQTCGGSGTATLQEGLFQVKRTCDICGGSGQIILNKCEDCDGKGQVEKFKELDVGVPPGVQTSTRLKMRNHGNPGKNGGPRGNLFVILEVAKHNILTRNALNVKMDLPISSTLAALGGKIPIPTLYGMEELDIEAGTQSGKVVHLKNKGIPDEKNGMAGDQIISILVESPVDMNARQKDIFERLDRYSTKKNYPKYQSYLRKVKKLGSRANNE